MSEYIRQNCVTAVPMTYGEYKAKNPGATDYKNQPTDAKGYEATYCTGYKAWIPKAHFERTSRPVDGLTFGMAVEAMRHGERVARRKWDLLKKWLVIQFSTDPAKSSLETICLASSGESYPWIPSSADLLSDDWRVICGDE